MDKPSLAIAYAVKKKARKMAQGGAVKCAHGMMSGCEMCHGGQMADGGMVDDGDMVKRIMAKRMSEGGMIANDTSEKVDAQPAEYDDLVLRDDLESSYTGANSGDEIGNAAMDEEDRDIVSRIMKSRAKKDRMPRPA